ncbi:hypothetical protein ABPG74_021336 [Tetrahymena malaccensis]
MSIKSISIEKFKSYSNCKIEGLSDKINILYGKNGSGKSNLLAALSFISSDQYDRADRAQLMKNYKEGDPKVEIELDNLVKIDKKDMEDEPKAQKVIPTSGDSVLLSRTLEQRENVYRVDDRAVNLNQFNNIFECFGLSRKNPFTIVAQNRIQEISNMSDSEIYKLLQQVAGIEAFMNKQEKAEELFEKAQREKEGIDQSLQEIEDKISQLSGEKEQYAQNQEQEILIQSLQSIYYDKLKEELQKKKLECNKEINNQKLQEEKQKLQDLENQKEAKNEELLRFKEKLQRLIVIEEQVKSDQMNLQNKVNSIEQNIKKLKSIKTNKDEKEIEARLKEVNIQCTKLQKDLDDVVNKISKEKDGIDSRQQDYEQFVLREKFKTQQEKQSYFNQRIQDIKQNINEKSQTQQNLKEKVKKSEQRLNLVIQEIEKLQSQINNFQSEQSKAQKSINDKKNLIQKLRQEQLEKRKIINDKKIELEDLNNQIKKRVDDIQKQLKSGLIQAIEQIEESIEKEGIQGYKGLLIDHLQFNSALTYAYDIAQKGKLFSLIVDNQNTASLIIDVVKKLKIKTSNLNIIPLDWVEDDIDDEKENQIAGFGFQKLFDTRYVKAKGDHADDIKRLAKNIFEKYGVIKEYEHALEVASQFKVNCITEKRQIVYSGGFISHVGFCTITKVDKITLYNEYKGLKAKKNALSNEIEQLEKTMNEIQLQQNDINSNVSKEQASLAKQSNTIFMNRQLIKSSEVEKKVLSDELSETNQLLQSFSEQLKDLEQEKITLENTSKSSKFEPLNQEDKQKMYKLQEEIKSQTASLQKALKEKQNVEKEYNKYRNEEQQLTNHLSQLSEGGDIKDGEILFQSIDERINSSEQDLKHQETILKAQKAIVEKATQSKKTLEEQIRKIEGESQDKLKEQIQNQQELCNNLEQQISALLLRKQQYISKEYEIDQKKELLVVSPDFIQKNSHLTKDNLKDKLNRITQQTTIKKYTAKDKILFEKLKDLDEKYEEYKQKYTELTKNEEQAKNLIDQFKSKCEQTIKMAFSKFEHYMKNYFKQISSAGTIDIKLMHNHEISISVAFKQTTNETKKTNRKELSGGEKSCLAILILMALQRCDPAPYYIFDEFDAALDAGYIRPIAKIISENSQKSQFLIVSHKFEFLQSLQQENCKCFQISLKDKVSEIEEKTLSAAINFVKNG